MGRGPAAAVPLEGERGCGRMIGSSENDSLARKLLYS